MAKDLQKEKKFQLRTERFTVSRSRLSRWFPPQYLNGIQAVILDEFTCIILAITALIWKHVLSAVVAVALFFLLSVPIRGFRGVVGAPALSEHAWLNEEIDFVNEKGNRWWLG